VLPLLTPEYLPDIEGFTRRRWPPISASSHLALDPPAFELAPGVGCGLQGRDHGKVADYHDNQHNPRSS
jgi:hypothetical protein